MFYVMLTPIVLSIFSDCVLFCHSFERAEKFENHLTRVNNAPQQVVLHDSAATSKLDKTSAEDLGVHEPKQVVL